MHDALVDRLLALSHRDPALLKRVYRSLARKAHPDTGGGDASRFLKLREAYMAAAQVLELEAEGQASGAGREADGMAKAGDWIAEAAKKKRQAAASLRREAAERSGMGGTEGDRASPLDQTARPTPPGFTAFRPATAAESDYRARGPGQPVLPRSAEQARPAVSAFCGVEYWKIKSPKDRIAFHLHELSVFTSSAPSSPSLWRSRFAILPDDGSRPWSLAIKRLLQVVPIRSIDSKIVAAVRRLDDYAAAKLGYTGEDKLFTETGEAALSLIAACLRDCGIPCTRAGEAIAPTAWEAKARFDLCRPQAAEWTFIEGHTGFRMRCESLAAALVELAAKS